MDKADEPQTIITDGAYSGKEIHKQVADKNIDIVTTGLLGRKPRNILLKFHLSEDGRTVTECPAGNIPKASSYLQKSQFIRVSFPRENCEHCPHRAECLAHLKARTAYLIFSIHERNRAQESMDRRDDETLRTIK